MKTDLVVAGFIFNEDKVLLIHRKKLDLWLPVGGHIEKDETPDEALKREIKEEVGLEVEILNKNNLSEKGNVKRNLAVPFYANVHSVGDHDHACLFYLCRTGGKVNINKEVKDFEWFSKEDLKQEKVPEDVREQCWKAFEILN